MSTDQDKDRVIAELREKLDNLREVVRALGREGVGLTRRLSDAEEQRDAYRARLEPISEQGDDLLDQHESCIGNLRHELAALRARLEAAEKALKRIERSLDNEADVDDGQPNDAMRFLTELRAALAATEPSK